MGRNNNPLTNFSILMINLAKFSVKLAIYVVVLFFVGSWLSGIGHKLFYEKAMTDDEKAESVEFTINYGDTVDDIANNLYNANLIDNKTVFKFRAFIYKTNFKPYTYELKPNMTIKHMLDIFDDTVIETTAAISETDENVFQLSPEEE